MLLKQIKLENFRAFDKIEMNFSPTAFTAIIGENGKGKTALLEAISIGIGSFLLGFDSMSARNINIDDVKFKTYLKGSTANNELQFPVKIKCLGYLNENLNNVTWERSLNSAKGKTTRIDAKKIVDYGKVLQEEVKRGSDVILPILAYYGTQRLWYSENRVRRNEAAKLTSRTHSYLDALEPYLNMKLLNQWFFDKKIIEFEDGYTPGELIAVQTAIKKCMENVKFDEFGDKSFDWNLEYSAKFKELQFTFPNGKRLPFRHLSDGFRNVIGLVADIAFRMASLNPHLEEKAIFETPGIILIDELDLHLHPKWQRHIISDLRRTFPRIQFIITTHSPFIIQSLEEGELRVISEDGQYVTDSVITNEDDFVITEYADKSIEDVTENVMGIKLPQWSVRKRKMYEDAKKYFKVLHEYDQATDEIKIDNLKSELDRISLPYSENVAYYAFLEQKRTLSELKKEKNNETD